MVKGSPLVLLEGALSDEEGEEFAFGHVHGGKRVHGVRVAVGEDLSVELDGEFETVAHEGDVADDRLPRNPRARTRCEQLTRAPRRSSS